MDPEPFPLPSTINSDPTTPPVPSRKLPSFPFLLALLVLLVLLSSTLYLAYQNRQLRQQLETPTSYEECAAASGSRIQESYPATCITHDGHRFIEPIVPTTFTPTPIKPIYADWKTYKNTVYGYTISFPQTWKTQVQAAGAGDKEAPPNAIMVDIYNPALVSSPYPYGVIAIQGLDARPSDPSNATKTSVTVNGIPATKYEYSAEGTIAYLIATPSNQFIHIQLSYGPTDPIGKTLNQILSTFKFTTQNSTPTPTSYPSQTLKTTPTTMYRCPANGWVDCMPKIAPQKSDDCSPEAMAWYEVNCSNFQGGAY